MSLFGSFSRTQSGSSLHKKPTTASVMTALCPRRNHLSTANPFDKDSPRHRRDLHILSRRPVPPASRTLTPESAESLFLEALSRASLCRKHARQSSTTTNRPSQSKTSPSTRSARFTTSTSTQRPPQTSAVELLSAEASHPAPIHLSRHKLRAIVDQYDYEGYQEDAPPNRDSHQDPSPSAPVHSSHQISFREPLVAQSLPDQEAIDYLNLLLQNESTSNTSLYNSYKAIPQPRPQYLQNQTIRSLMHRLAIVEFKDERTMQRYLSVVDDMLTADVPMTRPEWNSAMSFAGRYLRKVGDVQVDTTTQIWLRMEKEAGITSSATTFSILFDVATKAGKFALADIVVKEMLQREIEPNRYFRTNIIYCHGLKRDGAAVRRAYQDFVDAGEIIDTVVLNCVIASLINAGEPSAAEYIFEKMKALGAENTPIAKFKGWKAQRHLGKVLDRAGQTLRKDPERRVVVQNVTPITPNLHTYRLLIKYHARESGNIDRISALLDEMQQLGHTIHGSIFYQIIRGFSIHGGIRYSSWNKKKLDSFWEVFCQFAERDKEIEQNHGDWMSEEDRGCYLSVSMVQIVLMAYHKVTGPENTRKVWQEIKEVWRPSEEDEEHVNLKLEYSLVRS